MARLFLFWEENIRKVRLFLVGAGLAALFAVSVQAADVSGKWTAQVPGRDGQTHETNFNFEVEGETLTGTMSGQQFDVAISQGTVQGDSVSFKVAMNFGGNDLKLVFKGTVAGDEIKFTRTREGSDQTREFTAKRAK